MEAVDPGKTTAPRPLEINMPKDRKLTDLIIVQGFSQQTIPLNYSESATPTSTPAPSGGQASQAPGGICPGALLLPLTLVGAAWAGVRLARK